MSRIRAVLGRHLDLESGRNHPLRGIVEIVSVRRHSRPIAVRVLLAEIAASSAAGLRCMLRCVVPRSWCTALAPLRWRPEQRQVRTERVTQNVHTRL